MSGGPSSGGSPDACASRWRSVDPGGPAGSPSSTVPSSIATSNARPVASFVIDAQRSSVSGGPYASTPPPARVTPAAAIRAPQRSMTRNASTAGDTRSVDRRVISSCSSLEERFGYSRAVVTSDRVYVAGTAPIMPGDGEPPAGAYEQMRRCLEIVGNALAEAGAAFDDVVRTRVFLIDRKDASEAMRAHG